MGKKGVINKTELVRFFLDVFDRVPGEAGGGGVGNPSVKGMTNKQFFKDGITETQQQVGFKIDKQLDLSFFTSVLGFVPGEAGGGVGDSFD